MEASDLYYKDIRNFELLTGPKERMLFDLYRTCSACQYKYTEPASIDRCPVCNHPRNLAARSQLVTGAVRYVAKVARDYLKHSRGERHGEDLLLALVSAGNLGLLVAVDRFDLSRGTRFLTYAAWWIREKILEELDSMGSIRIPAYQQKAARARWRDGTSAESDFPGAVIESLDLAAEQADDKDYTADFDERMSKAVINQVLRDLDLSLRERYAIKLLYGFREAPRTLRQIAQRTGISSEAVRDIRRRVTARTKNALEDLELSSLSDI
jgi:RNA polymerase primary sigma factor